ncbi:unnamed protein product, partial [Symbiodinium sp. KB8]
QDPVDDDESAAEEVASISRRLFESPECKSCIFAENAKHRIQEAAGIHPGNVERLWRSSSDHPPSPSETLASSAWSLRSRLQWRGLSRPSTLQPGRASALSEATSTVSGGPNCWQISQQRFPQTVL